MPEREPKPSETTPPGLGDQDRWWSLQDVTGLDLLLGHGADAPDPADLGTPRPVTEAMDQHVASSLSRRRALTMGAAGLAAGLAGVGGAGSAAAAPRAATSWRGTVTRLNKWIDTDYLRWVTRKVTQFGDTEQGWRPGGSPANLQAADWIERQMRHLGMSNVGQLPVPIDRWVFNGASVTVDGGPTFEASSWGGVPGTRARGISAEVIDVGLGQAADYEGIDVRGKIVLVNWAFGDHWVNRHGHQATLEGALAIIFYTGRTADGAFYNKRDDGLLSFDGTYNDDWVPFVFVTRNAANDLLDRVAAGTTRVTLKSDVELTRADDGGVGYNVLGAIPGTDRADEFIIFTGHHDAWFRGAADDATAIAAMLGIVKAIKDSGFKPRRTLLFLASTNEEYGYTDAYYEWLIGAWYAVTHQRPNWGRKAILSLDFELLGTGDPGERLLVRTHGELLAQAVEKLEADPARTPYGTLSQNVIWANADHFTLAAAGIPSIYFNTVGPEYLTRNYHTNFDLVENVDFDYLRMNIEVINDIWVEHDRATVPILDFVARATEAEARIDYHAEPDVGLAELPGVDQAAAGALRESVARFRSAATRLDARLAEGHVANKREVGAFMMKAERRVLRKLVALDVFDQYIFPHEQVQRDATRMQLALNALEAGNPSLANETYVRRTGLTNAGRLFAYQSYAAELERHSQDFERLQWGGQAHLAPYVNLWTEYHSIAAKVAAGQTDAAAYAAEITSIRSKLDPLYQELNRRLRHMTRVFETTRDDLAKARRRAQ